MILSRYHNEQFLHWLYVIIMPRTSFRVNLHSVVCLNVKELLARSRRHIWSLSDSNVIRTYNHLVRKRTLNHLAKLTKLVECSFTKWVVVGSNHVAVTFTLVHNVDLCSCCDIILKFDLLATVFLIFFVLLLLV